jgi:hypothetical protein
MKFMKWWIQSYLVNIEKIKVGFRTLDGIVTKIEDLNVNQIINSSNRVKLNLNSEIMTF